MSTDREKLEQVEALIAAVKAHQPASTPGVIVTPGAHLPSVLANLPADAVVTLADGFTWVGGLTIAKPVTLLGGTLHSPVVATVPHVHYQGVVFQGAHREHTALTLGDDSTVHLCRVLPHATGLKRAIAVNCARFTITKTYAEAWHNDDAQAIAGWDGTADGLIEDCELLGSGQSFILGGSDPQSVARIPQRVKVRRTKMWKREAWLTSPDVKCKNTLELKNVIDFEGAELTLDYSPRDGQDGYHILLTVRSQQGTVPSTIEDVWLHGVTGTRSASGIQILGQDYTHPSKLMRNVLLEDITLTDISPTYGGGIPRCLMLQGGGVGLHLNRCQFDGDGINTAITFAEYPTVPWTGLVIENGSFAEGWYGIRGSVPTKNGQDSLNLYAPGALWRNMTIRKGKTDQAITWPPGTIFA